MLLQSLLPGEAIPGEQNGYYTTAVPGTLASAVSRGEGTGKQAVKSQKKLFARNC